jgi:hypothetical protein
MFVELEPTLPKVRLGCGLRREVWFGVVSHAETISPLALEIVAGLDCSNSRPVAKQQMVAERISLKRRYLTIDWFISFLPLRVNQGLVPVELGCVRGS